jgi:hypothetical protein
MQSIDLFFYFVQNSGKDFMNEKNTKILLDYLKDRAFSIRKGGIQLLSKVFDHCGQVWFEKTILPKILPMFKSQTFIER